MILFLTSKSPCFHGFKHFYAIISNYWYTYAPQNVVMRSYQDREKRSLPHAIGLSSTVLDQTKTRHHCSKGRPNTSSKSTPTLSWTKLIPLPSQCMFDSSQENATIIRRCYTL
ncbi:hypothetical protein KC19_5G044000 [Ceratodon purpureus]|uniref:Uncharacterized protein n=1 Tax=Ceratodon purpureus TaxID=3225 RepID=A0A8T0HXU5_CERPU|nr:hypothetical protein KC19_5G044000 [Ceratodon purpureus]